MGSCREDADDLERRDVPIVFLAHQLALDKVRAGRDVVVDHFQSSAKYVALIHEKRI